MAKTRLNEYLISKAAGSREPVVLILTTGQRFIGVIKGYNFNKTEDVTLYKLPDGKDPYGTFHYTAIAAIAFATKKEMAEALAEAGCELIEEPTPF